MNGDAALCAVRQALRSIPCAALRGVQVSFLPPYFHFLRLLFRDEEGEGDDISSAERHECRGEQEKECLKGGHRLSLRRQIGGRETIGLPIGAVNRQND